MAKSIVARRHGISCLPYYFPQNFVPLAKTIIDDQRGEKFIFSLELEGSVLKDGVFLRTVAEQLARDLSRPLTVETKYFYAIGTTSTNLAGNDSSHFFVTTPYPGPANPTRIWILGDSGTAGYDAAGASNAAAVRDAYYDYNSTNATDVWLMLGDNAYPSGTDLQHQIALFDMYPSMLLQTALWPTFGPSIPIGLTLCSRQLNG